MELEYIQGANTSEGILKEKSLTLRTHFKVLGLGLGTTVLVLALALGGQSLDVLDYIYRTIIIYSQST